MMSIIFEGDPTVARPLIAETRSLQYRGQGRRPRADAAATEGRPASVIGAVCAWPVTAVGSVQSGRSAAG